MESSLVTVNCGGCHYSTARETILREPSSKLALQVRGVIPALKDASGYIFIDRDPRFFPCILNYLRDGWVLLPASPAERRELMQEVRHFQLNGMESWLRTQELLGEKSDAIPKESGTEMMFEAKGPSESPVQAPSTPKSSSPKKSSTLSTFIRSPSPSFHRPVCCPPPPICPPPCRPMICAPRCDPCCCDPCRPAICSPCIDPCLLKPCIPQPADDGFRWTSKYLRTNPKIREIVDTILELAYMPPNRALSVGKVFVSITNCPAAETYLSNKTLLVKICGAYGWTFEFTVRPSCDYAMYQKYNLCEFVQDNWFVLSAILKDQFGVCMEEDYCQRHASILSRRYNLHICLSKPC